MNDYSKFFSGLRNVSSNGNNSWQASCPAHHDEHPSLSIKVGSQGALIFRCHASTACSQEDILEALGLGWDDVFPGDGKQVKKSDLQFVEAYTYRDGEGVIRYQVCRMIDKESGKKTFRQRRVNPKFNDRVRPGKKNPEWLYDMSGVDMLLYRYPEMLSALRENRKRYVFVVEGEKDVDNLAKVGITATTNAGGAGRWKACYNQEFDGLNVVVIPDEDPVDPKTMERTGLAHAIDVANNLLPVVASLKLIRLFPKGKRDEKLDVSDWLVDYCHGLKVKDIRAKLAEIIKESPSYKPPADIIFPNAKQLSNMDIPETSAEVVRRFADLQLLFLGELDWDLYEEKANRIVEALDHIKELRE